MAGILPDEESLPVAGEVAAQADLVAAEALERVAVQRALVARVLHRPAPHALAHRRREGEPRELVDPRHLGERIRDELLVAHVEEAPLVRLAHVEAPVDPAPELLAPLAPDVRGVGPVAA